MTADPKEPFGVGLVGCGSISAAYLETLVAAPGVHIVGCTDENVAAAQAAAERFSLTPVGSTAELLALEGVAIVLNLTPPLAHVAVSEAALRAGKHVYSEKPLAATFADASRLMSLAEASSLRIGAAPDTFLGAGWQTARRLIDDGLIGVPMAADAAFFCGGHEEWHPRPSFYYALGGGPLMDMGPYYLTGLVSLLGPAVRVTGSARAAFAERTIKTGPDAGTVIPVAVPTHIAGVIEFASGPIASLTTSFDVWSPSSPRALVHGSEATLELPDPNEFSGTMRVWTRSSGWREIPLDAPADPVQSRGLGLLDMSRALTAHRPHRASGAFALHVLEIMEAIGTAAQTGEHQTLETTVARPEPLLD